jgi:hypothetical protein
MNCKWSVIRYCVCVECLRNVSDIKEKNLNFIGSANMNRFRFVVCGKSICSHFN